MRFILALIFSTMISANVTANSRADVKLDFDEVIWTAIGNPQISSEQSRRSLKLDGNSCLKAINNSAFDFPNEFTMEAWIFPTGFVTDGYGGESFSIFSRWLHGIRTLYLVQINNGKLNFYTDFAGMISLQSQSDNYCLY